VRVAGMGNVDGRGEKQDNKSHENGQRTEQRPSAAPGPYGLT
jgi:hypothetical protein